MADKTIANMSEEEFDALVEQFIERGEDKMTSPTTPFTSATPKSYWSCERMVMEQVEVAG